MGMSQPAGPANGLDPNRDASYQTNPEVRTGYPNDQQMESDRSLRLTRFYQRILDRTCNATT